VIPSLPENEALRLQALRRLQVLDTPREPALDRITRLAADICGAPMARISLVDANRQWFKSAVGTDVCETSRETAFCAHAILRDDILVIPDAKKDPRFRDNPSVTGPPGIRFYAGAPLTTHEGYRIGSLCVEDTIPREITATQLSMLSNLAAIAVDELETRLLKEKVATAERDRRAAEEIYASIVASIREVVFQISEDGRWTFINPAWTHISGYAPEETLHRNWLDFVLPEDRDLASGMLDGGDCEHGSCETLRFVHKDGSVVYMEVTVRPKLNLHRGRGFTGTLYDLTEHRRAEERIRRAKLEAEKASRAKSDFLSRMSHEIRTPMNALLGFSELLAETELNQQQRSYVQIFHSSAQRLLTLVNEVLDLSKVEAGEMRLQLTDFNAVSLASETIELLKGDQSHRNGTLHLATGLGTNAVFRGDAAKIRQVLLNLVGNALKFSERGDVYVRVRKKRIDEETLLQFEVRDTGPGIPRENLASIFEAFFQVDASLTRRHRGSGLGLAICRELTTLMGGEIEVESELGKGSTFRFFVPVTEVRATECTNAGVNAGAPVRRNPDERRLRVLIAEDSQHNILLWRAFLGSDFDIEVVNDGASAVERVMSGGFDLVLMDVQMPIMDGLTATGHIREWEQATHAQHIPILALTAHALEQERIRALEAGCDAHLSKPIGKRQLIDAIWQYAPVTHTHK